MDDARACVAGRWAGRCSTLRRRAALRSRRRPPSWATPLDQLAELQLQLIEQPGAALGRWSELLMLQLGDGELEVLDLGIEVVHPMRGRDQHRLQRYDVIGQLRGIERHEERDNSCFAPMSIRAVRIILRTSRRRHTECAPNARTAPLSCEFGPPCVLGRPPVDPLEQVSELRR